MPVTRTRAQDIAATSAVRRKHEPTWSGRPDRSAEDVTAASAEMQSHCDALVEARVAALEQMTEGARLIGTALRTYGEVWRRAARASMRPADHAPNRPAIGHGQLEPVTSKHSPRRLKQALGGILATAGVDVGDFHTRLGQQRRRRGRR
jgi:hypothetical protein